MYYTEILNDPYIIELCEIIDKRNKKHKDPFNHGLKHINNLLDIMKKLILLLRLDEYEMNLLLITCVLHDLGLSENRRRHGEHGAEIASDYLDAKLSDASIEKIMHAIKKHDTKDNLEKEGMFVHLIILADMLDITYDRLEEYYKEYTPNCVFSYVKNVRFKMNDERFAVILDMIDNKTFLDLMQSNYFKKVLDTIKAFSKKLNRRPLLKVGKEVIDLKNYKY